MNAKTICGLVCAAALLCGVGSAQAEFVQGDINGWTATSGMDTNRAFVGDTIYSVEQTSSTTRASSGMQFTQYVTWDPQWGTGTSSTNAAVNSTIGQGHSDLDSSNPGNLTFAETSGMVYSFRLKGDSTWWYRPYAIQATTNSPVEITSVSDNSAAETTNIVTVSAGLSAAPGGETLYVRYTTNDFANEAFVAGSVTGTNASLSIPAMDAGSTVSYYVLSSTLPITVVATDADLCTLRANNAGGTNYSYVAGAPAADLGNAWHVPANAEPAGATMRNPRHPYATNAVTIYNGNQFAGTGTTGDQSGGTLYYRLQGAGGWSSAALAFDSESGNNKYWKGEIPSGTFLTNQTVEYALAITYNDRDTTYLGTTNQTATVMYAALASAQANPFSFSYGGDPGKEPGYVWHGGNVVRVASDTIQIWAKIGYQASDGYQWADHAEVRYVITNGLSPSKRQGITKLNKLEPTPKGIPNPELTTTNTMIFSHTEPDSSENGNAMWWVGTIQDDALTNLESEVQYQVAAWNSGVNGGNDVVQLAEYNADGESGTNFLYRMYSGGADALTVNGQNADYTTTKFFIDEATSNTAAITVLYTPPGVPSNVEVFSNVGRRDLVDADWNSDGVPDGIQPPDGNLLTTNDTGAYFTAFPMTWNGSAYEWTTNVGKCGAYRLTARYHASGQTGTNWTWYSSEGRRDHAIVISPKKVLEQTMYELNTLTVKATNNTLEGRSTFADLISPTEANRGTFDEFSIEYLNKIQANCLWFQPIHPAGINRSENVPGTDTPYVPGSPYATRDYFAVNGFFGSDGSEATALTEFTNFVARCDAGKDVETATNHIGTINVMLDGVFNHTSWDAEFGEMGVTNGLCATKDVKIGAIRPGWYSRMDDYGEPATTYTDAWTNDIATAPDRGDFGKWADVAELYYGKYSCLVRHNPDNNGDYLNEEDVYDFEGMSSDTIELWEYIGRYTEFWLQKTGNSLTNRPGEVDPATGIAYDDYGIDGLRCDFGQGLPPQLWEYIINRTRSMKWNFMFMAETLDGGVPGYRSNRHFDILNENMVFQFTQAHVSDPADLRTQLENRRTAYNGGAILLNLTGHDEVMPWSDSWVTASRYAMVASVMGVPMTFYGQEQGIGPYDAATGAGDWTGFADFELNFGKYIPHFKRWNKLRVWGEPPLDAASREMAQWYGHVNWARLNSPALQSPNQYFLSRTGGGDNSKIFAVAKYESAGAVANGDDAVLAFSLFVNDGDHSGSSDTYDLAGCWDLLGLSNSASVYYNVKNLASSDASSEVWPTPRTGADLYSNGIWVGFTFDESGGSTNPIYSDGAIVQFLKIEEADAPVELEITFNPVSPILVPYLEEATFTVTVADTNGSPVADVVTNLEGSITGAIFTGGTFSYTVSNTAWVGQTNWIEFSATNAAAATNGWIGVVVPVDSNTNGMQDVWERTYFTNYSETASGDTDGDGISNDDEYTANTDPTVSNAVFGVENVESTSGAEISVPVQPDRAYRIEFADGTLTNTPQGWTGFQANGHWTNVVPYTNLHLFTDDGTAASSGSPVQTQRNYRVWVGLP